MFFLNMAEHRQSIADGALRIQKPLKMDISLEVILDLFIISMELQPLYMAMEYGNWGHFTPREWFVCFFVFDFQETLRESETWMLAGKN